MIIDYVAILSQIIQEQTNEFVLVFFAFGFRVNGLFASARSRCALYRACELDNEMRSIRVLGTRIDRALNFVD